MSITPKDEGRIDIIRREVYQIDEAIRSLPEKRAALLRELNDLQASTRLLPPEILCILFQHFSEFIWDYHGKKRIYLALTLGHVSWFWRQLAWSMPQLWNDMSIRLSESNAHGIPPLLRLHFQNVGNSPLSLTLSLPSDAPPPNVADAIRSIEILLFDDQNAGKIGDLSFYRPIPSEWRHPISSKFSQLTYFSVENRHVQDRDLLLHGVPHLRHVSLSHLRTNVSLPWLSITDLDLTSVAIDICVKLLTHCPNLTRFASYTPDDPLDGTAPLTIPDSTITLHHMEAFEWGYYESGWCSAIQHVQFPALREFTWSQRADPADTVEPVVRALLPNLADTLRTLNLSEVITSWTLPLIRRVFSHVRHLHKLYIGFCDRRTMYRALCALCPGWEGDETVYLPALRSLVISELGIYDEEDENRHRDRDRMSEPTLNHDFSYRILGICKAKIANGLGDDWFELQIRHLEVNWAPGVQEELGAMVQGGFKLRIQDAKRKIE